MLPFFKGYGEANIQSQQQKRKIDSIHKRQSSFFEKEMAEGDKYIEKKIAELDSKTAHEMVSVAQPN